MCHKFPLKYLPYTGTSPATPRLSLDSTSSSGVQYKSVQLQGCEMLALMLGQGMDDTDNPSPSFTVTKPQSDVITGVTFFSKHAPVFIGAVRDCIINLGEDISGRYCLGQLCEKLY